MINIYLGQFCVSWYKAIPFSFLFFFLFFFHLLSNAFSDWVVPENIHTSPTEGNFSKSPPPCPPLWKFRLSFIYFFKFSGLGEPPIPQEIPIPSVGGVWIFSGTEHFGWVGQKKNKKIKWEKECGARRPGTTWPGQHGSNGGRKNQCHCENKTRTEKKLKICKAKNCLCFRLKWQLFEIMCHCFHCLLCNLCFFLKTWKSGSVGRR